MLDLVPNQRRYYMAVARNAQAVADAWVQMSSKRVVRDRDTQYRQIEASILSQKLYHLALSNPPTHGILLLNESIYADDLNYALGYSANTYTVIANGGITPFQLNFDEFRHVLWHELGHRFGATELKNRPASDLIIHDKFGAHCKTPGCIMNIVNSVRDVQKNLGATFCPGCIRAIKRELSK